MKINFICFDSARVSRLSRELFSAFRKQSVLLAVLFVFALGCLVGKHLLSGREAGEQFAVEEEDAFSASGAEHYGVSPEDPANEAEPGFVPTFANVAQLKTMDELQKYLYNIDKTAYVAKEDLDLEAFLAKDFTTEMDGKDPKILIFHTHSQEAFQDSRPGAEDDTVVGVGKALAAILANDYNISVVHDTGKYDFKDGKEDREESYQNMEPAVKKLLEKYPSVEIAIDMHRDGVPDNLKFVTEIDGKPAAKIMFFNGVARISRSGAPEAAESLANPYVNDNLALSLQMQLTANEMYPGFARKIYIKPYRYSLHLLPKSMLVEVGANTNTVEEAKNAMVPLAKVIAEVFLDRE